jgi:energy-converting hydrogenase Eha subunit E
MTLLALVFCILICAIGVVCIAAPSWLVDVMLRHAARMLYYAAGFRILFGAVLVLAAPASRAPDVIYILGIVVIVAGIILLFVGQKRFREMINWLAARGPTFVRVWGVLGLLLGWALGYALAP